MKIADTSTPVVVLNCDLGALSIMRTLGYLGVDVFGVGNNPRSYAFRSRYCRKRFVIPYSEQSTDEFVDGLLELRAEFSKKPILIATSDETAIAVAGAYARLESAYSIAQNAGALVATLADKMTMFGLARRHGVPAPKTTLPATLAEASDYARSADYPVMLKGAMGNRLYERTGKKMVVVGSESELLEQYELLQDPERPNLMIQELIPGDDDQVYIFNGYFDHNSDCLAAYTGRKIRQFPIHVGCASLGECCWVPEVAEVTTTFMKEIGYRGILDIGYRKDPRDGSYKVLDINPRVGQAFRIFVSEDDMDVVRALYLDLTGQGVPTGSARKEGRRWIIEDYDVTSSFHYYREGSLSFGEWIGSFKRLEEAAWFSWRDPLPFIDMLGRFVKQVFGWFWKRIGGNAPSN